MARQRLTALEARAAGKLGVTVDQLRADYERADERLFR